MSGPLEGKTVVVFGSYGLIGSAIVAEASARDAHVLAIGRDEAKLSRLAETIPGHIQTIVADLDIDAAAQPILPEGANVDAVIMPLGGTIAPVDFAKAGVADVLDPMRSKLMVQHHALRSVLPNLSDKATVQFFSGLFSRSPMPGMSAITAMNAAIEALTRALAQELAPLRVTCIAPAQVKPSSDRGDEELSVVTPQEVADLCLSLIGSNVSGTVHDIPRDASIL